MIQLGMGKGNTEITTESASEVKAQNVVKRESLSAKHTLKHYEHKSLEETEVKKVHRTSPIERQR